jgi:hypothetical protein
MSLITPGIDFLLAPLSIFALVSAYLNAFIADRVGYTISTRTLLFAFVFSLPLAATIYILPTRLLHRRQAATLGARMVPEIKGILPGNFDFLLSMMRIYSQQRINW